MEDTIFYRRKLPHWELRGSTYFITFTCVAGLVLSSSAKDVVLSTLLFHAGKKYKLYACVVMETHVHSLLRPLALPPPRAPARSKDSTTDYFSLAQITHSLKSYSAKRVNRTMGRRGAVWLDESYDRIMRDDKELSDKFAYILTNPVKTGLVEKPDEYKWLFVDEGTYG